MRKVNKEESAVASDVVEMKPTPELNAYVVRLCSASRSLFKSVGGRPRVRRFEHIDLDVGVMAIKYASGARNFLCLHSVGHESLIFGDLRRLDKPITGTPCRPLLVWENDCVSLWRDYPHFPNSRER
jgi:hypothetical protein